MRSNAAKAIHVITNALYWTEHPTWQSGSKLLDLLRIPLRVLPFSFYRLMKDSFFKEDVVAIAGESVVREHGNVVRKYLLRRPGRITLADYELAVRREVTAVTDGLGTLALKTRIGTVKAEVFKLSELNQPGVYLEQVRLDYNRFKPFLGTSEELSSERTRRDLILLLQRIEGLTKTHGYVPDLGPSSGNLVRDSQGGRLLLIDVLPLYTSGERLLGDKPSKLPNTLRELERFKNLLA